MDIEKGFNMIEENGSALFVYFFENFIGHISDALMIVETKKKTNDLKPFIIIKNDINNYEIWRIGEDTLRFKCECKKDKKIKVTREKEIKLLPKHIDELFKYAKEFADFKDMIIK